MRVAIGFQDPGARSAYHTWIVVVLLLLASVRFLTVMHSGLDFNKGDFYATLPGPYPEHLNPTLFHSPEFRDRVAHSTPGFEPPWYGPAQYLTLYPIVFLDSYEQIALVLLFVYTALIIASVYLLWRIVAVDRPRQNLAMAAIVTSSLLFTPLLLAWTQREFEVVAFFAMVAAVYFKLQGRPFLAGALFGYMAWFKLWPALFLGYFIIKRRFKAAAAFVAGSLLVLLISHWAFGVGYFFSTSQTVGDGTSIWTLFATGARFCGDYFGAGGGTPANLHWGLCSVADNLPWLPERELFYVLTLSIAAIFIVGFVTLEKHPLPTRAEQSWRTILEVSLVLAAGSFFVHGHYYYLIVFAIPVNALLYRYLTQATPPAKRVLWCLGFVLLTAFVLPTSLLSSVFQRDVWAFYMDHAIYMYGVLIFVGLLLWEYLAIAMSPELAPVSTRKRLMGAVPWVAALVTVFVVVMTTVTIARERRESEQAELAAVQEAAHAGDARAQLEMALRYQEGRGVPKDDRQVTLWYQRAADRGVISAQTKLADRLSIGQGVAKDDAAALVWYRKAAERGDREARQALARRTDWDMAREYLKAADGGNVNAMLNLGNLYGSGDGVPKDDGQATFWFQKAADGGNKVAQLQLGLNYNMGWGVEKNVTTAASWYRKASDQGEPRAQYLLGRLYATGEGVARDDGEAAAWFRKAADQGEPRAQYELGRLYAAGQGVPQDRTQALTWYRKAASQGHQDAKRAITQDGAGR